jgi:hypothetical protein
MLAFMVEPVPDHPTGLQHLVEEAQELRERLHRVAVALSITEDMVADAYERLATTQTVGSGVMRQRAKDARTTAEDCRAFVQLMDDLHRDE